MASALKFRRIGGSLTAAVLLLAACGGDDSTSESTSGTESVVTEPQTTDAPATSDTEAPTTDAPSSDPLVLDAAALDAQVAELTAGITDLFGEYPQVEGNTTRGITDESIKIGVVADQTYAGNPLYTSICDGANARIERANSAGDLSRTIEVADCVDGAGDAVRGGEAVQDLVVGQEVFALIMQTVPAPNNTVLTDEHVPLFGLGINSLYCGTSAPFGFGVSGAAVCNAVSDETDGAWNLTNSLVPGAYARASGIPTEEIRLAIIGMDVPGSREAVAQEARAAELLGMEVVYAEASVPPTATDFTPYISEMMATEPTALLDLAFPFTIEPALAQAGFEGDIFQTGHTDGAAFEQPTLVDAIDGIYGVAPGSGVSVSTGGAWASVQADAEAIGYTGALTSAFLNGYTAADMMIAAIADLEASGAELTAESLTNFINAGWKYAGIEGVSPSVSYPLSHYVGSSCSAVVQFDSASKSVKEATGLECGPIFLDEAS